MAKRGKPLGNKRQRERDKRRKKEEKAARRAANAAKGPEDGEPGVDPDGVDPDGVDPEEGEVRAEDSAEGSDDATNEPVAPDERPD